MRRGRPAIPADPRVDCVGVVHGAFRMESAAIDRNPAIKHRGPWLSDQVGETLGPSLLGCGIVRAILHRADNGRSSQIAARPAKKEGTTCTRRKRGTTAIDRPRWARFLWALFTTLAGRRHHAAERHLDPCPARQRGIDKSSSRRTLATGKLARPARQSHRLPSIASGRSSMRAFAHKRLQVALTPWPKVGGTVPAPLGPIGFD